MYDLSILIPSRNEIFISNTVEDILKNKRGKTEIIVGLDGAWADPGIPDHPDVRIVYVSEAKGQRGLTNLLAKLSQAKYVAKVDAHTAYDEGFDVKLMDAIQDDWTIVPNMRNLHAFDWVCDNGHRRYQGPTGWPRDDERYGGNIGKCEECDSLMTRDVLWFPKPSPNSTSFLFDSEPHFQYAGGYKNTFGYKAGVITGYNLSFDKSSLSPRIVSLLADFAGSHSLASSRHSFGQGQNMTSDAVGLTTVDDSGSSRTVEVGIIGNELEMQGVTTSPISTDVVNNRDMLSSTTGDGSDQPSKGDTMSETFIIEKSTPSITPSIDASNPIPTAGSVIQSYVVDKLNSILGGEFVYSEKTSSFHNQSVTLTLVRNKGLNYTMSLQGSFFMLTRDKYWELNICDEDFGSWGSQGIEVACKTWLSGGKVMCLQTTWYAHMFRTQGADFSFPYQQQQSKVVKAKQHAKNIFLKDRHENFRWDKQQYPLSWLLERFWPVPGWTDAQLKELKDRGN